MLKQITDAASGALSNSGTFNYDDLGRLLSVTNSPNMAGTFGYDAYGNMTSKDGVSYTYSSMAPSMIAQSRTVRAIGPAWSSEDAKATMPQREQRP